jgi:hypothetical protein
LLDWLLGPAFAWPSTSSPTPTRRNKRHFDVKGLVLNNRFDIL